MRLHRTRTNNYEICVEIQKTRIAKTILRRTELKVTCSLSPGYYKAILIKTKWYWHRTDTDQWDNKKPSNKVWEAGGCGLGQAVLDLSTQTPHAYRPHFHPPTLRCSCNCSSWEAPDRCRNQGAFCPPGRKPLPQRLAGCPQLFLLIRLGLRGGEGLSGCPACHPVSWVRCPPPCAADSVSPDTSWGGLLSSQQS